MHHLVVHVLRELTLTQTLNLTLPLFNLVVVVLRELILSYLISSYLILSYMTWLWLSSESFCLSSHASIHSSHAGRRSAGSPLSVSR